MQQQQQHVQQNNKNFLCICHLFLSKLLSAFGQQNRIENLNLPYLPTAKTELQKKLKNAVKIFSYTFRYSFHLPLFSLKNIYNKNRLSITDLKKTKTIEKTTNKKTKNQLTMKWISKKPKYQQNMCKKGNLLYSTTWILLPGYIATELLCRALRSTTSYTTNNITHQSNR